MEWLIGKARGVSRGSKHGSGANSPILHHNTSSPNLDLESRDKNTRAYTESRYAEQGIYLILHEHFTKSIEPLPLIDQNEWLAYHTIGLFDNISIFYDAIYEMCNCSTMTGPGSLTYVATDDRGKKLKCTARQYIDSVLAQCSDLIKSTRIFPTNIGVSFPSDFRVHIANISRSLFRILVHVYAAHFNQIVQLDFVAQLNTMMRHFFVFNARFSLLDDKEIDVLADLQVALFKPPTTSAVSIKGKEEEEDDDESNMVLSQSC